MPVLHAQNVLQVSTLYQDKLQIVLLVTSARTLAQSLVAARTVLQEAQMQTMILPHRVAFASLDFMRHSRTSGLVSPAKLGNIVSPKLLLQRIHVLCANQANFRPQVPQAANFAQQDRLTRTKILQRSVSHAWLVHMLAAVCWSVQSA